jgi:hypothetical protein
MKPHECRKCSRRFETPAGLRAHKRVVHPSPSQARHAERQKAARETTDDRSQWETDADERSGWWR